MALSCQDVLFTDSDQSDDIQYTVSEVFHKYSQCLGAFFLDINYFNEWPIYELFAFAIAGMSKANQHCN